MKKIIQLTTYPVAHPSHGGQIRVNAIKEQLQSFGNIVYHCSISESGHEGYTEDDLIISKEDIDSVVQTPFCGDLATALLCQTGDYYNFIERKINNSGADIIMLEQPWLWPAVKKYLTQSHGKKDVKIVYSSHNIEYQTKESIFRSHGIDDAKVISEIYELESDLCKNCDLALAVSIGDVHELRLLGSNQVIVAANGVRPLEIGEATDFLLEKALLGRKFALFVGSAYPPNAMGFWRMFGHSLSFLKQDELIVIAGGVSDIIMPYGEIDSGIRFQHNKSKIACFGKIAEYQLNRLIRASSVIILPITSGGGSNLKTAEAIASCRPVVATKTACRGFDADFIKELSDFFVCPDDDLDCFVSAVCNALSEPKSHLNISADEVVMRETVFWKNTLSSIPTAINSLYS
ncbi:glycosyltransferase [Acidithiobacillus sp. AC3]